MHAGEAVAKGFEQTVPFFEDGAGLEVKGKEKRSGGGRRKGGRGGGALLQNNTKGGEGVRGN